VEKVSKTDKRFIREFPDRGALWLLEVPENLRELIRLISKELAEWLNFDRAERSNRSLVPEDLQKREADIIYRVPFRKEGREPSSGRGAGRIIRNAARICRTTTS